MKATRQQSGTVLFKITFVRLSKICAKVICMTEQIFQLYPKLKAVTKARNFLLPSRGMIDEKYPDRDSNSATTQRI